jgi:DNA modification methylase/DNA-directed RNA polymerase subunit RPC12/RpoP
VGVGSEAMKYNPLFGEICDLDRPVKLVEEPYNTYVSAGKNTYVYDTHTYHTKVPPEGIELFIKYYTDENDVVLDPFCGSGMTGVAALRQNRKVLLSDLSPAATFIAENLSSPIDANVYMDAVHTLLRKSSDLEKQLYSTTCRECGKRVSTIYTVWSYGAICNHCSTEFTIWDVARDERDTVKESKILSEFDCPHCGIRIKKRELKRTDLYPVALGYKCCTKSLKEKVHNLTEEDKRHLKAITYDSIPSDLWYPTNPFPEGINTKQPISAGIDSVDKAYFPRALYAYSFLWNEALAWPDVEVRNKLLFTLTSLYQRITKFSEFRFWGGSSNIANYNVPHIINEQNVFKTFERKAKTIYLYFRSEKAFNRNNLQISTQSACSLSQLANNSVDYVFTDPPFGSNINYSEMNFLWESWLRTFTDNAEEAIVNKIQGKTFSDYGQLITNALLEIKRVLKPNGWFTMMFHNSSDKVWQELQTAIHKAGFIINGTLTFDKKHGTFKQFVSNNAVGYDLVLNCRKAPGIEHPKKNGNSKEMAAEIRDFLKKQVNARTYKNYIVHYEHVNRLDEFNFRKLYSEWIASVIDTEYITVDFERFREILRDEIQYVRSIS